MDEYGPHGDILPHIDLSRAQDLIAPLLVIGRGVGPELNGIGEGLIDRSPSLSLCDLAQNHIHQNFRHQV